MKYRIWGYIDHMVQTSEGVELKSIITPLGKTTILICGDLFDDNVLSMLANISPDIVLFPFARCFPSKIEDIQKEWDKIEKYEYINQAKKTNATVIAANYIGSPEIKDTSPSPKFSAN